MGQQNITLEDRYDLESEQVLLNGTQALVRLMLLQKARDALAGKNTAGYVTGYRGSPLGAVDMQMNKAKAQLEAAEIVFQEGLNEDLAATAIWGTQQAHLRGEGTHDGVFGLWYGKGPGVDRSGDAMRHANLAGTAPLGGVLMALGDDHTGESSTTCHQSDWAAMDAYIPVLSPAGVQEVIDFGLYGYALSRYAGVWAGLKLMKDTVEVTSVVTAPLTAADYVVPEIELPADGVNIRLGDHWIPQDERLIDHKRRAAEAFAYANRIDKRKIGAAGAKIGFVAAGKNWLDLTHAFSVLGIDENSAAQLGVTAYKVGQIWPLDQRGFREWADGLDLIVVVEERRKIIEMQIKEALFDQRGAVRVYGGEKSGAALFSAVGSLDPIDIAEKIGEVLVEEGCSNSAVELGIQSLQEMRSADNAPEIAARPPYFCSGCPHNTSTRVPDGSRAGAGIGCHTMALFMDRNTEGYTHMGAEGANWLGESQFSKRAHVFQNIGDGTYNHSGTLAIRAAVMAGTTITYKILFNDAVAMTGGQNNEGDLKPDRIARELLAVGVKDVFVVYDPKEELDLSKFPKGVEFHTREYLDDVQKKCTDIKGVSAIVYVQTCAAEKRRRRKRGTFADPDQRIFINPDVCEGCGDCGVQSNCVSIVPLETELGRKRVIDQSSCNKDFSCLDGFCPSFVTVSGAKLRKAATADITLPDLPEPKLREIRGTHNVVITGIGGTGVVTIGAVLAMAAHLDGKGAGMMEMAGLAQKGGAVHIHCRLANRPEDIHAIRVATGECDTLIGGDLVVSGGAKTLGLLRPEVAQAAVNSHEIMTGDFTRDTEFRLPSDRLVLALESRLQDRLSVFDATGLARILLGDSIFSNMIVFGAAWQGGGVPVGHASITQAITLNGTAVEGNLRAFEIGRWAEAFPEDAAAILQKDIAVLPKTLEQKIQFRADQLRAYQSEKLAQKYLSAVGQFDDEAIKEAVALGYHKVLNYKDEYEVARLLQETRAKAEDAFEGDLKLNFHLAPPMLSGTLPNGRPRKRAFGPWMERAMPLLARLKVLRGTIFDLFGYSKERKAERGLIHQFEADIDLMQDAITEENKESFVQLAMIPLIIRGFGPVKELNMLKAQAERAILLEKLGEVERSRQVAAE